jgi:pimeloyl-ACP methyl ester carboxylesterase
LCWLIDTLCWYDPPHRDTQEKPMSEATSSSASIRNLFDIGGRRLFLESDGCGTPTVILEAGGGCSSATWDPIWNDLICLTRACRYDRASLGCSDPLARPRTCSDIANDLHHLLQIAQIPSPYLLVGHSVGGLTVRVYAHHHPDEVGGIVLLDPSHHDSWRRERAILPPETAQDSATLREIRQSLFRSAVPPDGEDIDSEACQDEARAASNLDNLPLAVVTGTRRRAFPDVPTDITNQRYQLKYALHRELADLSSRGILIPATQSGHMVHLDEPIVVLNAIRLIITMVRADLAARE